MSEWQEGFIKALRKALWKNGRIPTDDHDWYYGMLTDRDAMEHKYECEPEESLERPTETSWWSFVSTFDDSIETYAIQATMSCKCGNIKNATVLWETSFGDALRAVLMGDTDE